VTQRSILIPLLYLAYVHNIWRYNESNIRLFPDDFIIYRKITDNSDIDILQRDLSNLGEWAVENKMKINPGKSRAVRLTKTRFKERIRNYFVYQIIPELSSFNYLGIIIRSNITWKIMSITHYEKHGRHVI